MNRQPSFNLDHLDHPMYFHSAIQQPPATTVIPLDDSNEKLLSPQPNYGNAHTGSLPGYYSPLLDEKTEMDIKHDNFSLDQMEHVEPPKKKVPFLKRHCITRWLCCTCCLPPCLAFFCWFIFVAIIICIIVIGAILANFTIPKVDFLGVDTNHVEGQSLPSIQHTSNGFTIPLKLNLNVQNPNPVDINLNNINATGFIPASNGNQIQVGTGHLDSQFIPKNSNTTFVYPFNIEYNPGDPDANTLLLTLIQKCGFTGEQPTNIDIKYKVKFTAKVLFVSVSPTINDGASIACPIQKEQIKDFLPPELSGIAGVLGNIGTGLSNIFGNDALGGLANIFNGIKG